MLFASSWSLLELGVWKFFPIGGFVPSVRHVGLLVVLAFLGGFLLKHASLMVFACLLKVARPRCIQRGFRSQHRVIVEHDFDGALVSRQDGAFIPAIICVAGRPVATSLVAIFTRLAVVGRGATSLAHEHNIVQYAVP